MPNWAYNNLCTRNYAVLYFYKKQFFIRHHGVCPSFCNNRFN